MAVSERLVTPGVAVGENIPSHSVDISVNILTKMQYKTVYNKVEETIQFYNLTLL